MKQCNEIKEKGKSLILKKNREIKGSVYAVLKAFLDVGNEKTKKSQKSEEQEGINKGWCK